MGEADAAVAAQRVEDDLDGVDVGPLGSTRKACPEDIMSAEYAFMQAVESAATYKIAGETLTLITPDGQLFDLTLTKQNP